MDLTIRIREENGQQFVSGKELYKSLGYNDEEWIFWTYKNINSVEYFIENEDFFIIDKEKNIDYLLTINAAKRLLILSGTQNGLELKNFLIKCEERIEKNTNKIQYSENIERFDGCILVREFSKILANEKIKLGEKMLYKWFRERGFILKNSTEPSQKAVENGFFKVIHGYAKTYRGNIPIKTTKVTEKGKVYFLDILKKEFQNKTINK